MTVTEKNHLLDSEPKMNPRRVLNGGPSYRFKLKNLCQFKIQISLNIHIV